MDHININIIIREELLSLDSDEIVKECGKKYSVKQTECANGE